MIVGIVAVFCDINGSEALKFQIPLVFKMFICVSPPLNYLRIANKCCTVCDTKIFLKNIDGGVAELIRALS